MKKFVNRKNFTHEKNVVLYKPQNPKIVIMPI